MRTAGQKLAVGDDRRSDYQCGGLEIRHILQQGSARTALMNLKFVQPCRIM